MSLLLIRGVESHGNHDQPKGGIPPFHILRTSSPSPGRSTSRVYTSGAPPIFGNMFEGANNPALGANTQNLREVCRLQGHRRAIFRRRLKSEPEAVPGTDDAMRWN